MLPFALYFASYLLGGIPFGFVVAKALGVDILKSGSGNIGATNVGRTLGRGPGIAVLLLDALKGAAPALAVGALLTKGELGLKPIDHASIAGTCAIFGHLFSPFLRFGGGKGISTSIGFLLVVFWPVGLTAIVVFTLVMVVTQTVSVSSLIAGVFVILSAFVFRAPAIFCACVTLIVSVTYIKHWENIKRILKGEEKKFSFAKKEKSADVG